MNDRHRRSARTLMDLAGLAVAMAVAVVFAVALGVAAGPGWQAQPGQTTSGAHDVGP